MLIWNQVNATELATAELDPYNDSLLLTRHEFLQCIIRIAMAIHFTRNADDDELEVTRCYAHELAENTVSAAVDCVCLHIHKRAPPEIHQDSNAFRRHHCYIEPVDAVLRKHEGSLRRIFEVYAANCAT